MKQAAALRGAQSEDHARLEVMLPWLLAQIADKIQHAVGKQGSLLLGKK
jgi:hypothetical protein